MAYELFRQIEKHHGRQAARRIFAKWGEEPSQRRRNEIKSLSLLDRLDMMNPPNMALLAREVAAENEALPTKDRRGPGKSSIASTVEHYIRTLVRKRRDGIKAGTWTGPFPPEK
ncbi:hypothetical protein [Bradyrhizobium sp. dw_411]|uniref:hypothetical protein n=1 Tax=Bradyrhizobium sp. dw_411 TaxID=2720082 RepID=UPI001BCDB95B|nr:hypothetical protein [Bradyrhizobium sp. dw_411]